MSAANEPTATTDEVKSAVGSNTGEETKSTVGSNTGEEGKSTVGSNTGEETKSEIKNLALTEDSTPTNPKSVVDQPATSGATEDSASKAKAVEDPKAVPVSFASPQIATAGPPQPIAVWGQPESSASGSKHAEHDDGDEYSKSEDPSEFQPQVDFKPVMQLTEKQDVKTNEEDMEQVFKMRAKLFRFDRDSREWKERGTGDVKLYKAKNGNTRLIMRRDRTLKVCANHWVLPDMKLSPNVGSDRSWVWNTALDVSEDPTGEPQTLAIRFANSENANLFKEAFIKGQQEHQGDPQAPGPATEEL